MIIIGLLLTFGSLGLGVLIFGAMANHPSVAGFVVGILLMIVGGVIYAIT